MRPCPTTTTYIRRRSDQADQFEDVVYTLQIITVYKGEPEYIEPHACEISFVTAGNSAACGVSLVIGEEYLVGLYWRSGGYFTANSCGLARAWNEEDMAVLEADGCDGDDEVAETSHPDDDESP